MWRKILLSCTRDPLHVAILIVWLTVPLLCCIEREACLALVMHLMMKYLCLFAMLLGTVTSCTTYRRVVDNKCAQACLGHKLGFCPIKLVVRFGKLHEGSCGDAGFALDAGTQQNTKAGPCGTIKFENYKLSDDGGIVDVVGRRNLRGPV